MSDVEVARKIIADWHAEFGAQPQEISSLQALIATALYAKEQSLLGNDGAWPIIDVLRKLAFAADHLAWHNCDHHGYEEIIAAKDAAHKHIERLGIRKGSGRKGR